MRVKIRYISGVRDVVGRKEDDVEVPEQSTVRQAIEIVIRKYKRAANQFWDYKSGKTKPNFIVMKNHIPISTLKDLETPLNEGDVIQIFPLAAGG